MCKQIWAIGRKLLCLALCTILLGAFPAYASGEGTGTLEVRLQRNVEFQLYFAAEETETGFQATEKFAAYDLDFTWSGADDLRTLATTLFSCVVRGQIEPDCEEMSDHSGIAVITGLRPGLYLLLSQGNITPTVICVREGASVSVNPKDDPGGGDDDDDISVKVLKVWDDDGYESQRPAEIEIELYRNGNLMDTVELSEENGWRHTWSNLPAGYSYLVSEKDVPEGYRVKMSQDGESFTITNTFRNSDEPNDPNLPIKPTDPGTPVEPADPVDPGVPAEPSDPGVADDPLLPQTGQLWWPVPVLALCGMVSFSFGWLRYRSSGHED